VQSTAFYLQWFVQLGSHSDTFQMAPEGVSCVLRLSAYGQRSVYGQRQHGDLASASACTASTQHWCQCTAAVPEETLTRREVLAEYLTRADGVEVHVTAVAPDGSGSARKWMNGWTIFYWGWWIAWAPFVGMFIAKISRGRTVRQIINGALTGPVIYGFLWFAVFGGAALRVERQAANLGIQCDLGEANETIYSRVTESGILPLDRPMVELEGRQFWRLSCRSTTDMWFDVFANFPMTKCVSGLGNALSARWCGGALPPPALHCSTCDAGGCADSTGACRSLHWCSTL
jgi:BCCT, betaine/carnitine/choline family transporter